MLHRILLVLFLIVKKARVAVLHTKDKVDNHNKVVAVETIKAVIIKTASKSLL